MPQKPKKNLLSLTVSVPKKKRGRPRKFIDPQALTPFEKRVVLTDKSLKYQEKRLKSASEKQNMPPTNPVTSDRSYTADEVEFMNALAEFKRASGRTFPTCSEILSVLRSLGYEKVSV